MGLSFQADARKGLGSRSLSSDCRSWAVPNNPFLKSMLPQVCRTCLAHGLQDFVLAEEGRALHVGPCHYTAGLLSGCGELLK